MISCGHILDERRVLEDEIIADGLVLALDELGPELIFAYRVEFFELFVIHIVGPGLLVLILSQHRPHRVSHQLGLIPDEFILHKDVLPVLLRIR